MKTYEVRPYIQGFIQDVESLNDPRIEVSGNGLGSNVGILFKPNPYLTIEANFNIPQRLGWVNFNGYNEHGTWNSWRDVRGSNGLSPEMWVNVLTNCIDLMN